MKNFKKLLCVLLAVFTVLSSLLIVPTSAATKSPKATRITKITTTQTAMTLTWKAVRGVTGYQIQISYNKKFEYDNFVWVKKASKNKKTFSGFVPDSKFYFRIRTYKKSGKKKKYSKWSSIKSGKTKKERTNNNNGSVSSGNTDNELNQDSSNDNINEKNEEVSSPAEEVLELVNAERAKQGIAPLTLSNELTNVANLKAKDMADNDYFNHDSPTYGSPFQLFSLFGISFMYAGENICAGAGTAQAAMNAWMNSPGHRANILNPNYTQLGVGYATGGSYGSYWVQEFICP